MSLPRNIDALLNTARVATSNALSSPKILEYLAVYGYAPAKIQQGFSLYETAQAAQQKQKAEYGEQIGATVVLNEAWETANKSYIKFLKIARITFKDDAGIATQLGLSGSRKDSLSGWLMQAQQFYSNLLNNPDLIKRLNEFGITADKLKAGQTELQAVETANLVQTKEKGESQNATKVRDTVVDSLSAWLSDFIAIGRIALEEEPQLLESLGILQRS
jgi:hypothetical protein